MKRLFWRLAPEVVLGSVLFATGGCNPNQDVKAGPPEVLSFAVVDNATGANLDIFDDAGPIEVSGFVHLTAIFDRLLDPLLITSLDGGVDSGANSVLITVSPAPPTGASISYPTIYTPNGTPLTISPAVTNPGGLIFGPGPTLVTSASPTFPSGVTITAVIDKTKVRSKKGEPYTGEGTIVFRTSAFAAAVSAPAGDPDPDGGADAGLLPVSPMMQAVLINFTNVPGADIASHVSVTAGGVAFTDVTVAPDASGNPTILDVTPNSTWPASTTIVVTVDATAADALGSATGAAATGSFTTGTN